MKRFAWFEILLIVVIMSITLYGAFSDPQNFSWRWFTRDDAYYYFKVAQNISEGHGSTFDGINKTNGYHPLWMLICVPIFALARFDLILPLRVLFIFSGALSVATAILLYRLVGRIFAPAVGAITAIGWVFSLHVLNAVYMQGLETGIAAFLIVLLIYKLYEFEKYWRTHEVSNKQMATLAVIATLTMFSRLDLVFLAGIVGLWVVFRKSLLRHYLPLHIAGIVVISLLAFISRVVLRDYEQVSSLALALIALDLAVKIPTAFLFGLYQPHIINNTWEFLKRLALFTITSAVIVGSILLTLLQVGILQGSFSRMILVYDLALTLFMFAISRWMLLGLQTEHKAYAVETPLQTLRMNWKQWLNDGLVYFGIVLGSLGVYMIWNKLAFGTTSPVSGQIKRWWASLPGRTYGGPTLDSLSFFGINPTTESNAWTPVTTFLADWVDRFQSPYVTENARYLIFLTIVAALIYLFLLTNRKKARRSLTELALIPLFSSAWLQVLSYHATGYAAFKEWYWTSQLVFLFLVGSLLIGMFYKLIPRFQYKDILVWAGALYLGVIMGIAFSKMVYDAMPYGYWEPDDPYMDIAPLLEAHTEPGSLIGMTGGGNAGYFIQDRAVVNMDGLINSYEYFQAVKARTAGEYLADIGLDYVLANPALLDQQPYKGQYNLYLSPTDTFYGGKQLMHYGAP